MDSLPPIDPIREEEQRRELKKMRMVASGLLMLMVVVFFASHSLLNGYPWLAYVVAFSEAAMVGALADWFAVTAFFRHPLGIPIPHTAIIQNNKDRIGTALANFLQKHFLKEVILREKFAKIDIVTKVATWMADEDNANQITNKLTGAIPGFLNELQDERVHAFLKQNITEHIANVPVAPLTGSILTTLTENNRHQVLLDAGLKAAARFLEENQGLIRDRIRKESPWYVPEYVDNKVYNKIISQAEHTLRDISDNPDHEMRERFNASVRSFIEELKTSEEYRIRGEQLKQDFVNHPVTSRYMRELWETVKHRMLVDLADQDSQIRMKMKDAVQTFGKNLLQDNAFRDRLSLWVQDTLVTAIVDRKTEIVSLISETVHKWDGKTMSDRVELQVGSDMQYIRINGTIVGGIVGLLLHVVTQFLF